MNNKISKYIMVIIGFIMLLINAISYIFNLDITSPAMVVLGLVFVVIGMKISNINKK
ncbi:MAG: hypothetical protein WC781_00880 [Candidatus Pacearchaeota archaeon]|jgi:uncharacterized membrane protein